MPRNVQGVFLMVRDYFLIILVVRDHVPALVEEATCGLKRDTAAVDLLLFKGGAFDFTSCCYMRSSNCAILMIDMLSNLT